MFDSGCQICSDLAEEVEREADGFLRVRSLRDSDIQDLLSKVRPEWRWEPTLLIVDGDRVRAATGTGLAVRLAVGVGPRRAARIARLVQRALVPADETGVGRRSFLRTAGASVVALTGLALLPKTATAAPAEDAGAVLLSGAEQDRIIGAARAVDRVQAVERSLIANGYVGEPVGSTAMRIDDGSQRVFLFYQPTKNAQGQAGAVLVEIGADGETRISAAVVSGDVGKLDSLTFTPVGTDDIGVLGVREYLGCMVSCLAATCASTAILICSRVPILAIVLACITAACGARTPVCHRVCRRLW